MHGVINKCFRSRTSEKSRVFGEAGSDVEFLGGRHEKIRVKKQAKPLLSSRIFESRPNQHETSRHAIPKSSGFFFLAQVVLTILCPVPEPRTAVFRVIKPSKKKKPLKNLLELGTSQQPLRCFRKILTSSHSQNDKGNSFQNLFKTFWNVFEMFSNLSVSYSSAPHNLLQCIDDDGSFLYW